MFCLVYCFHISSNATHKHCIVKWTILFSNIRYSLFCNLNTIYYQILLFSSFFGWLGKQVEITKPLLIAPWFITLFCSFDANDDNAPDHVMGVASEQQKHKLRQTAKLMHQRIGLGLADSDVDEKVVGVSDTDDNMTHKKDGTMDCFFIDCAIHSEEKAASLRRSARGQHDPNV